MLILTVHNDGTGTDRIGNYDVKAYINKRLLGSGRLENFKRYKGYKTCLKKAVESLKDDDGTLDALLEMYRRLENEDKVDDNRTTY